MSIYLTLFIEFFKIGLFSIGGGLATIPFLYDLTEKYTWITPKMISDIVAVAESTPGPIGINAATYVGFNAAGVTGGIVASLSLVLPSLIIIIIIAKTLGRINTNPYVITVFSGLRPVVTALIFMAGFQVFMLAVFSQGEFAITGGLINSIKIKPLILFVILFLISLKKKFHPIVFIGIAALVGIAFSL